MDNKMKLGDFIAETINEIISGVSKAQGYAKKKKAIVNPKHTYWDVDKQGFYFNASESEGDDEQPIVTQIDFDILLTIGDDDKAQGGIGVFAASLGFGLKGEVKEYSESVNRIKFQILTKLPQQKSTIK